MQIIHTAKKIKMIIVLFMVHLFDRYHIKNTPNKISEQLKSLFMETLERNNNKKLIKIDKKYFMHNKERMET